MAAGRKPEPEIQIPARRVRAYIKTGGNFCPPKCGGDVKGTGAIEMIDGDEVAVARQCTKCGAVWDDFYQLADISTVTPKGDR